MSLCTLLPTPIHVSRSEIGYWARQHTDKTTHKSMRLHIYNMYSPILCCSVQSSDNYMDDNVVLQHVSGLGLMLQILKTIIKSNSRTLWMGDWYVGITPLLHKVRDLWTKCTGHKIYLPLFPTYSISNVFCSDKYLIS